MNCRFLQMHNSWHSNSSNYRTNSLRMLTDFLRRRNLLTKIWKNEKSNCDVCYSNWHSPRKNEFNWMSKERKLEYTSEVCYQFLRHWYGNMSGRKWETERIFERSPRKNGDVKCEAENHAKRDWRADKKVVWLQEWDQTWKALCVYKSSQTRHLSDYSNGIRIKESGENIYDSIEVQFHDGGYWKAITVCCWQYKRCSWKNGSRIKSWERDM